MDLTVTQEKGRVPVTVLHVKGSVDSASYEQLQTRALEAITAGTTDLLIDLSGVPYMSSAGLRVINTLFKRLNGESAGELEDGIRSGKYRSRHLKLLNPTPRVLQALRMAGYDMFLEIHYSLQDAVAAF